jgi:hypothetical protein
VHHSLNGGGLRHGCQFIKEIAGVVVNPEQRFDLSAQGRVAGAGLVQICAAFIGRQFQGCGKNGNFRVGKFVHGNSIIHHLIRENSAKGAG